jgi:terminase small subunit-like protein
MTPHQPDPPDDQPRLGTKRRLDIAEERELFCEAIVEHGGVRKACEALGLHTPTVWTYAKNNAEFEGMVWAARMIAAEKLYDECIAIADDGSNDTYVDGNGLTKTDQDVIARSRLRIETRMRVAGKLIPKVYGENQTAANVNVGVQVGVICDEETRKRLIAVRQSLALRSAPTHMEIIEVQPQPLETEKETENVNETVPQIIPAERGDNHAQPEHDGSAT